MKWTDVPHGEIHGAQNRLWTALGDNAGTIATRINTDPAYLDRLITFANNGAYAAIASHKEARTIMGKNFFGIEEAVKHFGVKPTDKQLAALKDIPFSEDILRAMRKTHVLVAVFDISLLDVRAKAPHKTFYSYEDAWYNPQDFAKDAGTVRWMLICKTPVADSFSKNWDEQQALLQKSELTPSAQALVYTIVGHYLNTGERLFKDTYVRTSSVDSNGNRVYVGKFDGAGLDVSYYYDSVRRGHLGLASGRIE